MKTKIYLGKIPGSTSSAHSRPFSCLPCYLCRVHSEPSGRQWMARQSRPVYRDFSLLFHAPHSFPMPPGCSSPQEWTCSGLGSSTALTVSLGPCLLQHGLTQHPQSLWGVHALPSSNCSSLSHCLFLCSLFPLYFCPILNMFSQRCHKLLQMALATGVSIARSGTGQPGTPPTEATPAATSATRTLSFTEYRS